MDSVLSLSLIEGAAKIQKEMDEANKNSVPDHSNDPEAKEIDALVAERTLAKKNKNFARADEIRDILTSRKIVVTDTPNGPVWERI